MKKLLPIILLLILFGCSTTPKNGNSGNSIDDISTAVSNIEVITNKDSSVLAQTSIIKTEIRRIDFSIKDLENKYSKVKSELNKEKETYNKVYNNILTSIIIFSFLSVSVLGILFFTGHFKSTILLLIASGLFLGSVTLLKAVDYFIYIAAGYGIIICGTLVYIGVTHRRANKANVELVKTTEQLKPLIGNSIKEIADPIQSKTTKKIVNLAQKKLKLK